MRGDIGDLLPGNADDVPAEQPSGEPADPPRAVPKCARTAEDRDDLELFARPALQREVVDVAAAPPVAVEQLVVEEASYTFSVWPSEFAARRSNVQGFVYYPDLILRLRDLSLSA
jgi:hypothetical protein